jgi:hypothetical protein
MKHSEFHIGLEFMASAGFWWRCTDVGTRTILAIRLDRDDSNWYQGPPYIAPEVVFDEHEIKRCHLTESDAIAAAIHESETSGHPGYPHEVVVLMSERRWNGHGNRYPHQGVLRLDRRRPDGEILHPYAGRKEGETWMIEVYFPFLNAYDRIIERDFIALPMASADDIRTRADRG